jgi:hypothetical protein
LDEKYQDKDKANDSTNDNSNNYDNNDDNNDDYEYDNRDNNHNNNHNNNPHINQNDDNNQNNQVDEDKVENEKPPVESNSNDDIQDEDVNDNNDNNNNNENGNFREDDTMSCADVPIYTDPTHSSEPPPPTTSTQPSRVSSSTLTTRQPNGSSATSTTPFLFPDTNSSETLDTVLARLSPSPSPPPLTTTRPSTTPPTPNRNNPTNVYHLNPNTGYYYYSPQPGYRTFNHNNDEGRINEKKNNYKYSDYIHTKLKKITKIKHQFDHNEECLDGNNDDIPDTTTQRFSTMTFGYIPTHYNPYLTPGINGYINWNRDYNSPSYPLAMGWDPNRAPQNSTNGHDSHYTATDKDREKYRQDNISANRSARDQIQGLMMGTYTGTGPYTSSINPNVFDPKIVNPIVLYPGALDFNRSNEYAAPNGMYMANPTLRDKRKFDAQRRESMRRGGH